MLNAIESFGKLEALAERDGISLYALGKKQVYHPLSSVSGKGEK